MYTFNSKKPYQTTLIASNQTKNNKNNPTQIVFEITNKNFDLRKVIFELLAKISSLSYSINIDLDSFLKIIDKKYHQAFIIQLVLNNELATNLPFDLKSKKKNITNNFILSPSIYQKYKKLIEALTQSFNFARKLMLMPSNYLNPSKFVEMVLGELKPYSKSIDLKVFDKKALTVKKMGLILGVGQGSDKNNEPRLLTIKFKNQPAKFVLVGKGITFDTGGIYLKPAPFLERMQYDMAGAAIATGLMIACLKLKITPKFGVVIPLAMNDISDRCIKSGDILTAYNKKTIEITNSDAEGRLIMADAISYAINDMHASSVATIATLTGAIIVALGNIYTGYWSNSEKYAQSLEKIAYESGDYIWRMPFNPNYQKNLKKSLIADYTNCEKGRDAGAIYAAEFLHLFAKDVNFIHFDIAGSNDTKVGANIQPNVNLLYTLLNFICHEFQ